MKRPWEKYSIDKPWMNRKPRFGSTRHDTPEYHTRRWMKARLIYLNQHPICVRCEHIGRTTPATVVDHKISIANGGSFWDESNWQALCAKCHRTKTNQDIVNKT